MFSWFKKKETLSVTTPLVTDIHSHLLPNLDDGVQSFEQAEALIRSFHSLGYEKLITTPHVMADGYKNTTIDIVKKLAELNRYLIQRNISVRIEAAAEYYLDENVIYLLEHDQPLLTFGNKYLLFETNFINEPFTLHHFIFLASTKGYKPVLAHPERYLFLQSNFEKMQDLLDRGLLFQINLTSLTGYYSKKAQTTAQKLIDRGWVHFLGSDCHHLQHAKLIKEAQQLKYYQKALMLPLLNNTL